MRLGKLNSVFPVGQSLSVSLYPPTRKIGEKRQKFFCLTSADRHINLRQFRDTRPDHVRVESLTMSDKSSWDTFRKRRFSILKHLFYFVCRSSVNSLIPRPPNSMLCRRCGLCSRRKRKSNIVWGRRGKNVSRTLEFYCQVSQHFCHPPKLFCSEELVIRSP